MNVRGFAAKFAIALIIGTATPTMVAGIASAEKPAATSQDQSQQLKSSVQKKLSDSQNSTISNFAG